VAKLGLEVIPPFSYGALRVIIAIVVLAALMRSVGRLRPPARADLPIVVSYGLLGIALAISTMNLALPFVEAGRASILSYTLPLWVVPIVAVVARVRPSRTELLGMTLGLGGLALLLNPAAIDWSSPQVLVGVGLLLLGAVSGAAALVHIRAHRWTGTPFDVQVWQLLVALLPIGVLAVLLERDAWAAVDWDLGIVLVVLYSGALATAYAYWASQSIVRTLGPTTTSIAYLAVPVVGIITGAIILGEPITLLDLAGLVVTSAAVAIVVSAGRGATAPSGTVDEEATAAVR
jgi:drug/metabolite transporter (DMT)-like permease